jgi:hypothetical protein
VLGYEYLYAINVYSSGESFNLCPADICQTSDGVELARGRLPGRCAEEQPRVERADPEPEVIADVERIMRAADIEIGGVEYMIDDRDGPALLLRHQRALELRRRRAARSSASIRSRGLPTISRRRRADASGCGLANGD